MKYRKIVDHQHAIQKLRDTSLLPWEDVLETSDFFTDIDREYHNYNRSERSLQLEYARYGLENIQKRDEQKKDSHDVEDADSDLAMLSTEGLTVQQIEDKQEAIDKLLDTETGDISLPSIDILVIKKLYLDSKARREKEISTTEKKIEEKIQKKDEPFFTVEDVRAYIVLEITQKKAKKEE